MSEFRVETTKKQHRILIGISLGYVILAISYALATPPLESSDEYKHYPVVQYIQTNLSLPVLIPEEPGRWLQEAAQPPLYYILMAGVTSWIDTSDLPDLHEVNPHAFIGNPNQIANKNILIHQPELEQFPWTGSILAIYLIRFVTIVLGLGTIWVIFRLGTLLFDARIGLLATAVAAFNPMFLFVHAAVNNDALAILLANLGLYLLVKLWREAPDVKKYWWRYLIFGMVLGFGLLTKLSLAGLLALAGLALAWLSLRRRDWRYLIFGGSIVLGTALIILIPWLIRNTQVYGDPTAMSVFIEVQGTRDDPITWSGWVGEFGTFYRTFWGLFGGVNVAAPEIFYWIYNLIALAGVAGITVWFIKNLRSNNNSNQQRTSTDFPERRLTPSAIKLLVDDGLWLLIVWVMVISLLLIRWNIISPAFQGRLLFPAMGAIAVLLSFGLFNLVGPSRRAKWASILSIATFIMALLLPWIAIKPAYTLPEPQSNIPEENMFGPITFRSGEDVIQLIGVDIPPDQRVAPGSGAVELALYWRAMKPLEQNYLSTVHLLGQNSISVSQVNRYPASGMVPTSKWEPEQIWKDEYRVFVSQDTKAPSRLRIKASIFDPKLDQDLEAYGPDGEVIPLLLVGEAILITGKNQNLSPAVPVTATYSDSISFIGYDLTPQPVQVGIPLSLTLYWEATGIPSKDYTVFVHLLDALGNQVAGADAPPLTGDFPTHMWQKGELIADEHVMEIPSELPPGAYTLSIGLYDPVSGTRLPIAGGAGDSVNWQLMIDSSIGN